MSFPWKLLLIPSQFRVYGFSSRAGVSYSGRCLLPRKEEFGEGALHQDFL